MPQKINYKKIIYGILSFFIPFIVYMITLAPTVSWIDSDELTTASALLKIAHPTGYPLFTILGKLFTFIPSGDAAYSLNIMSAVISSAAVFVLFNLMLFLINDFKLTGSDKPVLNNLPENVVLNICLASSLLFAFSKTVWDNANVAEVYSLHSFFIILLIFLFLKAINLDSNQKGGKLNFTKDKYWILFAFVLGLSFANHMTTIFLFPGFIYLFISEFGFNKNLLKRLTILLIPFFLALTLYIYMIVRADSSMLSWGHTSTFDNFIAHITGRQYDTAMFRSAADLKIQLSRFIEKYPEEFVYLNVILIIPGLIQLFKMSRKLFYFTVILFVTCILMASNYTIYDIYSYYLLSSVVSSVWCGFGIIFAVNIFSGFKKHLSYVFILIFLLPLSYNYAENDKSRDYMVKDYVFNLFNSASENSIVITNYNPTYYFQYVKKIRPDIIFINRDYMYNKWYLNSIIETYPEVLKESRSQFEAYSIELDKLHKNKARYLSPKTQADNQDILNFQTALRNLLNSIIENNLKERNVYTTLEIDEVNDEKFAVPFIKTPNGVLLRLSKEKDPSYQSNIELKYELTKSGDYFKNYVMDIYYKANMNEAKYLIDNSGFDSTLIFINKALEIKPDSKEARQLLQKTEQLRSKSN
jgi:hypothetical protein